MFTATNDRFVIYVIRLVSAYMIVAILAFSCYKVSFRLSPRMEIAELVLNSIDLQVLKHTSPDQARKDIEKRTNEADHSQHAEQKFLLSVSFVMPSACQLLIYEGKMSIMNTYFRAETAPGYVGLPTHPPSNSC